MSLPVFCNHYKLSPRELKEILKRNDINPDLRLIKEVPEEWNEIVSKELDIPPLKSMGVKVNRVNHKKENDAEASAKLNSFEELEKLKQAGAPVTKENRSRPKKKKKKRDHFFVYVKFIAPDKSHAFVKKIEDLNTVDTLDLRSHENSFKIQKGVEDLELHQIVLVEEGFHNLAYIKELYFEGLALRKINHFKITGGKRDAFSVNSNVRFPNDFPDSILNTVKFKYNGSFIVCHPLSVKSEESLIALLQNQVDRIILKKELNDEDREIFELFTKLSETSNFEEKLRSQFEEEIENPVKLDPEQQYYLFLSKWIFLKPEWVSINTFKHLEKIDLYFISWLNSELPVSFWNDHLIDACVQYEQIVNPGFESKKLSFVDSLQEKHLRAITEALLIQHTRNITIQEISIYKVYKVLIDCSLLENKEEFYQKIDNSCTPDVTFDLWLQNETDYFPKEKAIKLFDSQGSAVQARILNELTTDEVGQVISTFKGTSDKKIVAKLVDWIYGLLREEMCPISFDLESDTKLISEIAWNQGESWSFFRHDDVPNGLSVFSEVAANPNSIFCGHNIVGFDCPILEEEGVIIPADQRWDTLLVEMVLRPKMENFSLVTSHTAKKDAQLTLNLFCDQVVRILKMNSQEFDEIILYFSSFIRNKLRKIREQIPLQWLEEKDLINLSNRYFRPVPPPNPIFKKLSQKIAEAKVTSRIIVGPQLTKREFLDFKGIHFINKENDREYRLLDKEKIQDLPEDNYWVKLVLQKFIADAKGNEQIPYWGTLATAIQLKISDEVDDLENLFTEVSGDKWDSQKLYFLTVDDLKELEVENGKLPKTNFYLVYPELISITNKTFLKEVDLDYIISLKLDNHFWMKFSGGQSFVGIDREQCRLLKVEAPEHFSNFWIEKYQYSKFRIWGNYEWENLFKSLPVNEKITIQSLDPNTIKEEKYFARVNLSQRGGKEIIRFNPESIYRSRYWVFQKELINQIVGSGEPAILFVQQKKEIESLEIYFRSLGYYIPERDANMARRMELLHYGTSPKKIVIETPERFDAILRANYSGNLTVILDSFSLAEKFHIAKSSSYFRKLVHDHSLSTSEEVAEETSEEAEGEDSVEKGKAGIPLVKDTFFHLSLEKPLIQYYSDLIFANNPENKLWILDPRISDFPDYGKTWGAKSRSLNVWKDYSLYEEDVKHADKHIHCPRPLEELPFSLEDTKQILSSVFLGGEKWYDYQEPCLDVILPGKEDVLVSLPTGGGKSLLFQAPALFRSAFTNRLTLVITPLKALMEDQVLNLWDRGFYGSVEYLNSDRNTDTPLIYRSLAGGEISLLFITPERFRSRAFLNALEVRMQSDGGLEYAVFDEAHCVSQWGHEFRPDYFNAAQNIKKLRMSTRIPLLLFSATVSEKIFNDFKSIFNVKETVS